MYAVIRTGGKQYKVAEGDQIEVEHLFGDSEETTFTPLLVVTDSGETIYSPKALREYPVTAKLLGEKKGDKVTVFKYRPKSGYSSKNGHRQLYSMIEITAIGSGSKKKAKAAPKSEAKPDVKPTKAKSETKLQPKAEAKPEPKGETKAEPKPKAAKPDPEAVGTPSDQADTL